MPSTHSAPFITFEGVDGAGKSSHIAATAALVAKEFETITVREPGTTQVGEKLREILLGQKMDPLSAALLAFASREEMLRQVVRPALDRGAAVICDRFTDSTFAYQGSEEPALYGTLKALEQEVHGDLQPDLTLLFDLPVEQSMARLGPDKDVFESRPRSYFAGVREGYHDRLNKDPSRFCLIDSSLPLEEVKAKVQAAVSQFLLDWEVKANQNPAP